MLNHVSLQGRLVRDPEIRRTATGKAVCSFTIACDNPGKNAGASFIPCVAWEKTAEFLNNYFIKGSPLIVEGRLTTRTFETSSGEKRTVSEVVATQINFCGGKTDIPMDTDKSYGGTFEQIEDDEENLPF